MTCSEIFCILSSEVIPMKDSEILYYSRPSRRWTDALPLGNGSLGAMVFGTTNEEKLSLNLDTLWSGFPHYEENPAAKEAFETVRRQVFEDGQIPAVTERLIADMQGYDSESYLPLGELILCDPVCGPADVRDYSRTLDLSTAVQNVRYLRDGAAYSEEWFVSHGKNVLVGRIRCAEPIDCQIMLRCMLEHRSYTKDDCLILDGQAPGGMHPYRTAFLAQQEDPAKQGMFFRTAVKVRADGKVHYEGCVISLEDFTEAVIVLAAEDSFNGFDKHPVLEGKNCKQVVLNRIDAALAVPYDTLLQEHIAEHQELYNRVHLDIGSAGKENVSTNERLNAFGTGADDPGLYALLFNYGRYLAISASRPGTQAMNLQGIWNHRLRAPWASNYTVNINTEMNYWPILMCNMAELNEPLVHMMQDISVAGRRAAQEYYGADGFTCHHNSDIWRMCVPATGSPSWSFWYNGAGWLSRHLYEQYEYTMDKDFLRRTAFPILKGCAEFYLSILTEAPDGSLVCAPSTSPENLYLVDDTPYAVSQTTTMTMSICREVLQNTASACEILETEPELLCRIRGVLPRLLGLRTGKDGRLLEWYKEENEAEVHHRHVSHLYALHPANQISAIETPELADACRKTLETRGDDGTGWSLGWKINFWARLRDGNRALRLLNTQLRFVDEDNPDYTRGGGTYANLFDAHPPFQIDGNFGAVSGIAEMLLQSLDGRVYLLPALPDAWSAGSVTGLRAKGGLTVSIFWNDGKLSKAEISGNNDCVTLRYANRESVLSVYGTVVLNENLEII